MRKRAGYHIMYGEMEKREREQKRMDAKMIRNYEKEREKKRKEREKELTKNIASSKRYAIPKRSSANTYSTSKYSGTSSYNYRSNSSTSGYTAKSDNATSSTKKESDSELGVAAALFVFIGVVCIILPFVFDFWTVFKIFFVGVGIILMIIAWCGLSASSDKS